jgi:triosephosphate isomerase
MIVANWKMNGSIEFARNWANHLKVSKHNKVVVCPPFPLLSIVKEALLSKASLGAQDCHSSEAGACTGFTSATLLREIGCDYVIVGHSERRFFEFDHEINKKALAAQKNDLTPIICVGEPQNIREKGDHLVYIRQQLKEILPSLSNHYIVAYEPIWAIGTGLTASSEDILEMHQAIWDFLVFMGNPKPKILYGGSVNAQNVALILSLKNVHGVLVGGASLKIDEFNAIVCS